MWVRASSAHEAALSGTIHLDRNGLILREVKPCESWMGIEAYWQGSLLRLRLSLQAYHPHMVPLGFELPRLLSSSGYNEGLPK